MTYAEYIAHKEEEQARLLPELEAARAALAKRWTTERWKRVRRLEEDLEIARMVD